jgi:hypothetical protein
MSLGHPQTANTNGLEALLSELLSKSKKERPESPSSHSKYLILLVELNGFAIEREERVTYRIKGEFKSLRRSTAVR